jgi:predicted MFS family arabinose efflux permease
MRRFASLAPLGEREFRLLFLGRFVSFVGSAFAPVAIAFAVLEVGSASDLGLVLAANMLPTVVFVLVGGVIADRLPRHAVLVASNLLSGAAQAVFALAIVSGHAQLWQLMAIQAVRGTSSAFFFPASQGIVPEVVSAPLLREANVLLRLSRNATSILGAAVAGIVVAAVGPAWGLAVDAASYFLAAALLAAISLPERPPREAPAFVRELLEGWDEFRSRTWLWVVVVAFGVLNAAQAGAFNVLGPPIAKDRLGGADSWGFILAALSAGLIAGGLLALRIRPRRALLVGCLSVALQIPPLLLLAVPAPTAAIAAAAFCEGIGVELFGIYWDLSLQQHVPSEALSRVSSYDALGSWVLVPIGFAVVGPIATVVGARETLIGAAVLVAFAVVGMAATREIRRLEAAPAGAPSPETELTAAEAGSVS